MLYRFIYTLAVFFAVSIITSRLKAQVQYDVIQTPVCWHTGSVDSSIVKFSIVTTSGAYLDLGFFDVSGTPVTVTGGTTETGFCGDSLTIDSSGFVYTLNLGNQSVNFRKGAEKVEDLLDGRNYPGFLAIGNFTYLNNTGNANTFFGKNTNDSLVNVSGGSNTGNGFNAMRLLETGSENTASGRSALVNLISGSQNTASGALAGWGNKSGQWNLYSGNHTNGLDSTGSSNTMLGSYSNADILFGMDINFDWGRVNVDSAVLIGTKTRTKDTLSTNEIAIGAFVTGKGSNSATIGNSNTDSTFLNGALNLNGYGSGNRKASDLSKTESGYLAAIATDGTIIELSVDSVGGGGTVTAVTADNGLTETGTATAPNVQLGGTLIQATTIEGARENLTIDSLGLFRLTDANSIRLSTKADATTYENLYLAGGFGATHFMSHSNSANNQYNVMAVGGDGVRLSSDRGGTPISFSVDYDNIYMKTPGTIAGTATAGQFLKLVNAGTGLVEFDTIPATGGGFSLPTDSITFNNNTADAVAGKLQRNNETGTLVYGLANDVPLNVGQDQFWYVKNQTGAQIDKGAVVRAAGTLGSSGRILIDKMIADGTIEGKYLLGIAAENIADGADGVVISQGKIRQIDLTAFSEGAVLYTSTTSAGSLTDTVPQAPNLIQPVAFVVDSSANGTLAVRIETTISTTTASNGITATTSGDNTNLKLGGTLTENTTISGNIKNLTFNRNLLFTIDSVFNFTVKNLVGADMDNRLFLGSAGFSAYSENATDSIKNGIDIDATGNTDGLTIYSENTNTNVATRFELEPEKVLLQTPNINNVENRNGDLLALVNSTNGEIEYKVSTVVKDTASAINFDFHTVPRIYQFNFTGKSAATVSFSNVKSGTIYTIHVINADPGDVITWPANCKDETGTNLTSYTFATTGRIFAMYYDGLYYYIK